MWNFGSGIGRCDRGVFLAELHALRYLKRVIPGVFLAEDLSFHRSE